ncbi:MAG: FGGY family carbohydrate kinase, partial [Spirochaetota bacterium]
IVDYGSSSCRASIVDENWSIVESARVATGLKRDESGGAEVDPDSVWATIRKTIHRLVSAVDTEAAGKIDALGFSTIFGYVFLDGRDQPLGGATTGTTPGPRRSASS